MHKTVPLLATILVVGGFVSTWTDPASSQTRRRMVVVTGLDDINLGTWNGFSDLRGEDAHCVGSRPGIVAFSLHSTGSGTNSALSLSNGQSELALNVAYNDGRGSGWQPLLAGKTVRGFQSRPMVHCRLNRDRAILRLFIPKGRLGGATPGRYRGTIALTIVPE